MLTDDNDPATRGPAPVMPDAHGQAALLLVESLIHGLLARSAITTADAIGIVESAASVQVDVAEAAQGHSAPMWRSHALLTAILESLTIDSSPGTTSPDAVP